MDYRESGERVLASRVGTFFHVLPPYVSGLTGTVFVKSVSVGRYISFDTTSRAILKQSKILLLLRNVYDLIDLQVGIIIIHADDSVQLWPLQID